MACITANNNDFSMKMILVTEIIYVTIKFEWTISFLINIMYLIEKFDNLIKLNMYNKKEKVK